MVLMGSGEIAPSMRVTHRRTLEAVDASRVTLLDTPYGFQENAAELSKRISAYFRSSLGVATEVVSIRPDAGVLDRAKTVSTVGRARYVFAGPGSPSYALRAWLPSGMDEVLRGVIRGGGAVVLASAAAVAAGVKAIPVYEIYKVGDSPFWLDGLDLTSEWGLPMVVVPHWNNAEGGTHDTSRCYIGARRLGLLEREIDVGVVGIDEHTALTVDFGTRRLHVTGLGQVTLRGVGGDLVISEGEGMELGEAAAHLGGRQAATTAGADESDSIESDPIEFRQALADGDADGAVAVALETESRADLDPMARSAVRSMIVELGEAARHGLSDRREIVGPFVEVLLDLRFRARAERRYAEADRIRDVLGELGIEIRDTSKGVVWLIHEP